MLIEVQNHKERRSLDLLNASERRKRYREP